MKIVELLNEIKLDIPDQMVSVQIPLTSVAGNSSNNTDDEEILNPGKRADSDGNYKWSPPLQQQLDVAKDAVGDTNDETNEIAAEIEAEKDQSKDQEIADLKRKIEFLLSRQE